MTDSGYKYHCSAGETFDSAAVNIYGDEQYAADLLWANPSLCDKLVFTGGEMLVVPVVETPETDATMQTIGIAPWRE